MQKRHTFLLLTAWRETLSNLRDFRVMILSLFLGIFVISLIFNITGALENGLRKNGKAILGGDILIRQIYQPITSDQINFLEQQGQISTSIEMRGLVYNPAQEQAGLSEVKAIDKSYPLFGAIELLNEGVTENIYDFLSAQGNAIPPIIMNQSLADRLQLAVGETVRLGTTQFVLKDIIISEPDKAGGSTFSVGPRSMMSIDLNNY